MSAHELIKWCKELIAELVRRMEEILYRLRFRVETKAEEYIAKHQAFVEHDEETRMEISLINRGDYSDRVKTLLVANVIYIRRLNAMSGAVLKVFDALQLMSGREVTNHSLAERQARAIREARRILDTIITLMENDNTALE